VVDALAGERFTGVSPDQSRRWIRYLRHLSVRAWRCPDPSRRLKPGMFARVNIVYERREDALQLRGRAILDADAPNPYSSSSTQGRAAQPVRTGLANNGWLEVVEGLDGSERVVVVPGGLQTGTAVKVVDASSAAGRAGRRNRESQVAALGRGRHATPGDPTAVD